MNDPGVLTVQRNYGKISIFTICYANYLAKAAVLGASLSRFNQGMSLVVFVIDDIMPESPDLGHLTMIPAKEAMSEEEWLHRRMYYNPLEFATSIKPACFLYLRDRGAERTIYLDPDIQIFHSIEMLLGDGSDEAEIILTPHALTALPDDDHAPSNLTILNAGLYNLGFASVGSSDRAGAFLAWWGANLRTMCLADPSKGLFTDQKWVDFAPVFFTPVRLLTDPGANVAYWNLHERTVLSRDGRWHVRSSAGTLHPLIFFHFSGFSVGSTTLSMHETRFGTRPPGQTSQLLDGYRAELITAGQSRFSRMPLPALAFPGGGTWDPVCRALYRQALDHEAMPAQISNDAAFLSWMAGHDVDDLINRYQRAVLRIRPDLASAFGDGRNADGLAAWLRTGGVSEMGIDPNLLVRLDALDARHVAAANYVGYFRAHLGVGEAARNTVAALRRIGVTVVEHDISHTSEAPLGDYRISARVRADKAPNVTILGCNADALPGVLASLPTHVANTYRVGCWYWEAPEFPEIWVDRFDEIDEVWTATNFVAQAVRAKATVPVVVMPPMIDPPRVAPDRDWLTSLVPGLEQNEFVFCCMFDMDSVSFRKNPEGAIAAFVAAFAPTERVRLIVKAMNGDRHPAAMARLQQAARGHRVSVVDVALESLDRFRLLASIDCMVSLHRSEGFGLGIAEAMAYGLPVVVSDWSGSRDYANKDNAALVSCDPVIADTAHGPYPVGTVWGEPRLDEARVQMRRVYDDAVWRESIGRAAAETISTRFSSEAVGAAMTERLRRISLSRKAQIRVEVAPPSSSESQSNAWRLARPKPASTARAVARDILKYPGYYVWRRHHIYALLKEFGFVGLLRRAHLSLGSNTELKRKYRLTPMLKRALSSVFLSVIGPFGIGRNQRR